MSDYVESVQSEALRIRWISVQCYEMVLPNGKTIVTDPFYWEGDNLRVLPELTKQQANSLINARKIR